MLRVAALALMGVVMASSSAQVKKLSVELVGDSTMTDAAGYGIGFCANLTEAVTCVDSAKGGASTKTYREQGLWDKALAVKPDYILLQLGHNDVDDGSHLPRNTTLPEYEENMRRFVHEARAAGIKVVLVTSIARRYFQPDGTVHDDLDAHVAIVRKIAKEMNVPLIDLHAESVALFEKTGPQAQTLWGATKVVEGKTVPDKTHFNLAGSMVFGRMVAIDLGRVVPELAQDVKREPAEAQEKP